MKRHRKSKPVIEKPEGDAPTPQFISRRKAMKIGDVCYRTILRMEQRGQLTPHKLSSRCVRLDLNEVLQVFNDARVAA